MASGNCSPSDQVETNLLASGPWAPKPSKIRSPPLRSLLASDPRSPAYFALGQTSALRGARSTLFAAIARVSLREPAAPSPPRSRRTSDSKVKRCEVTASMGRRSSISSEGF